MKKWWGGLLVILTILTVYVSYTFLRPLELNPIHVAGHSLSAQPLKTMSVGVDRGAIGYINPEDGSIHCRALGNGDNYTTPRPTASIAKLITVQVVLDHKTPAGGLTSEIIAMTADDEARYWQTVASGGSNVKVIAGEQFSLKQIIEGILLASANNMADSLAIWAFGSLDNYFVVANQWLEQHNLYGTVVGGDASGFSSLTRSTPTDLCKITLQATKNPALAEILSESEATMPSGEVIKTTNRLLGQNGVFAGKTGYTDEAGRGVVVASRQNISGVDMTLAAVSLSNDSYDNAFATAGRLIAEATQDVNVWLIDKDTDLGEISSKWGNVSSISTSHQTVIPYWVDQPPVVTVRVNYPDSDSLSEHSIIGQLMIDDSVVNLVAANGIEPASLWWRFTHPF